MPLAALTQFDLLSIQICDKVQGEPKCVLDATLFERCLPRRRNMVEPPDDLFGDEAEVDEAEDVGADATVAEETQIAMVSADIEDFGLLADRALTHSRKRGAKSTTGSVARLANLTKNKAGPSTSASAKPHRPTLQQKRNARHTGKGCRCCGCKDTVKCQIQPDQHILWAYDRWQPLVLEFGEEDD